MESLEITDQALQGFCRKWRIIELAAFGSILTSDFNPQSDIDLLVVFEPDAAWSLLDLVRAEHELGDVLGRQVQLVERHTLEQSANRKLVRSILRETKKLYAA